MSLPLIGNMLELRGFIHLKLAEWADQYGDIFQIWFARNRCYVINDLKLIKEVYNDPAFAGRIDEETFTLFPDGPHGVLNSSEYAVVPVEHFLNDVFMSSNEFLREANVDIWVSTEEFVKPHVKIVMDFF
ncbi:unnamed protein product [Allacma fusca]|uniref:Cytochrome P450 n=1 Tax=Allacma fusca TaxID=39272 RepID=A0A8J2L3I4_9HEXA|nr:unnamed protein product [Allacma fusca]